VKGAVDTYGLDGFEPGDVLISNDPRICGQHLNNIVVFTPIFFEGKLVAFPALRAHWVDVGGGSRGFGSTASREIFHEGLQLCGLKIYKAGQPIEEVIRLIRDNIRFPDSSFGDLRAQIAGCRLGERRMQELYGRYGFDTMQAAIAEIWDQSERLAHAAVRAIPDGTYEAESFMDHDFLDRDTPVPIKVRVIVSGEEMTVDFSDLPPQVKGPMNAGESGGIACARVAFKCIVAPNGVVNEGEMRPLKVLLPPGTILSAQPPAPLAFWSSSMPTVIDTILRALSDVLPGRIPAGHKGDMSGIAIYGRDEGRGRNFICLNIFGGGFGAKQGGDGVSGVVSVCQGAVHNAPVEVQEAYYPLVIEAHRLRQDSGGAGRQRGGLGVELIYTSPQDFHMNTHLQRTKLAPWGLHGGGDALAMDAVVEKAEGTSLPGVALDGYRVQPGDRVIVRSGGGGGYGPARERAAELVQRDVVEGLVSFDAARRQYGVVLDAQTHAIDHAATAALRARMADQAA
jgi:N-methylhydantoinase B